MQQNDSVKKEKILVFICRETNSDKKGNKRYSVKTILIDNDIIDGNCDYIFAGIHKWSEYQSGWIVKSNDIEKDLLKLAPSNFEILFHHI